MDLATLQSAKAADRDDAMQRLRDLTIAVSIAALGAAGLFAWISAATIPGQAGTGQASGQSPSGASDFQTSSSGNDFETASGFGTAANGSGRVVSGGSH